MKEFSLVRPKPTSPGRRFVVSQNYKNLAKKPTIRSLLVAKKRTGARNNQGRITVQHHGGGSKRKYRLVDFRLGQIEQSGIVETIEFDPNRTAHILRVLYKNGQRSYILAPKDVKVGDKIVHGSMADIVFGHSMPLRNIPLDTKIHNIELQPGKYAQMVRSAGTFAVLVSKEGEYAVIRLPSTELRRVRLDCCASIGVVSNKEHALCSLGKAGCSRHLGIRPTVRGVAKNPVDHPHGGGEGKSKGRIPVSPTGVPAKGYRTRKKKHMFLVRRRK